MATAPALGIREGAATTPRLRLRPTASGVVSFLLALVILAAALNTGNNLLYLLTGLIVAALPVSLWLSRRSLRALRAELLLPGEVTAGEEEEAALRLRAEGRLSGTISANQRDDFACVHLKRDVLQRLNLAVVCVDRL